MADRSQFADDAEVDAEARALTLMHALEAMPGDSLHQRQAAVVSVLMQWYHRGVIDGSLLTTAAMVDSLEKLHL